ncbi:oligosaccharide flippase family protein [uncultured Clostridium sp.]|uniref:oligosaccharide flippase family protein n=1 Tax=uncultured Clostridium sp. TaxID=59620 RepID=UPI0025EFCDD7|nr:oligosaccharide flippase family protein [uncultured Clostridium sp.]
MAKSISKNALFKSILNIFNIILPIIVTPVITRTFTQNQMSYITQAETFNTVLIAFAGFGAYQYGLREISRVRDDKKKLSQTFTSLFIISTTATIIVTAIYMFGLFKFYKDNPAFYACFIMGFNIVLNLFYVEWVNEALENYDFIALKTMIVKIIYSVIILCAIHSIDDFNMYIYLGVAVNVANNLWSYFYIKKRIKFDFSHLKIKKYVKPMFLAMLLSNTSLLYTQCDRLLIISFSGEADLAAYGIAQKAMTIINTLMLTIIQVSMPRLANNLGNDESSMYLRLLNKVMRIYFLLLFPASIGLLCVSKHVMWIFNVNYIPWYPVMMGFSIYMLTLGVQGIISNQIIYLYKKEKEDVKIFFICGIFNVVLNFILLMCGLFTPANSIMITALSNILVILCEYRIVKKELKLNIKLFGFENMKYFYYSILFIPLTFIVNLYVKNMIISCAFDILLCGVLYLSILVITKDKVFFDIYERCMGKFKNVLKK